MKVELSQALPRVARWNWQSLFLIFSLTFLTVGNAGVLRTEERTLHTYFGDKTVQCLAIDGALLPLIVPGEARVEAYSDPRVVWPKEEHVALFRPASPEEIALLEIMDKPDASAAWEKYLAATLRGIADNYTVYDFQPDILAVNHWRIGAITLEYSLADHKYRSLLLLWRCRDGSTIAVTLRGILNDFQDHRDALYQMIGGSMLLQP